MNIWKDSVPSMQARLLSRRKSSPLRKNRRWSILRQPLKEGRLEVQRVRLKKPAEVVEQGVKREVSVVLEFRVTSQAIPVRALDPVLVVGEVSLREYRYEDHDHALVFTLYDPEKAKD